MANWASRVVKGGRLGGHKGHSGSARSELGKGFLAARLARQGGALVSAVPRGAGGLGEGEGDRFFILYLSLTIYISLFLHNKSKFI